MLEPDPWWPLGSRVAFILERLECCFFKIASSCFHCWDLLDLVGQFGCRLRFKWEFKSRTCLLGTRHCSKCFLRFSPVAALWPGGGSDYPHFKGEKSELQGSALEYGSTVHLIHDLCLPENLIIMWPSLNLRPKNNVTKLECIVTHMNSVSWPAVWWAWSAQVYSRGWFRV